jgi:hypothetical protein
MSGGHGESHGHTKSSGKGGGILMSFLEGFASEVTKPVDVAARGGLKALEDIVKTGKSSGGGGGGGGHHH